MMRFFLYVFALFAVTVATDSKRQSEEDCLAITANLTPILEQCMVSVESCLTANVMGIGQIEGIQSLICPATKAVRENLYDVVVGCIDKDYADLLWSGICGSTVLSDGTELLCTDAAIRINNGSAAKTACCDESGAECAEELRLLTSDIGCCTGTVMFDAFFDECEDGNGLNAMFDANNVTVPELCDYPLYDSDSTPSNTIPNTIPNIIIVMIALLFYNFFY